MTNIFNFNETELASTKGLNSRNEIVTASLTVDNNKNYYLYESVISFSRQPESTRKQVSGLEAVNWLLENQCNHLELHVTPEMVRHSRKFEG